MNSCHPHSFVVKYIVMTQYEDAIKDGHLKSKRST